MAGLVGAPFAGLGAALMGAAWELRRAAYARGWRTPTRVGARVVSLGNLTVGGAGKTTLALHLAARAADAGVRAAVVCRRYRPGPQGEGDEERLFRAALGPGRVYAGTRKRDLAARAAADGVPLVLVDDGFSHWALARDLDVVLLDATDAWGGGRLLPAGRLREPRRALQRAHVVVLSRVPAGADVGALIEAHRRWAPAAWFAAGRHEIADVAAPDGAPWPERGAAHVVTATGNPDAVAASAREAGFDPVTTAAYRDHHWFTPAEAARERSRAAAAGATVLLTAKDAVRWPAPAAGESVRTAVLHVRWRWLAGGDVVERWVIHGEEPWKRPTS